MNNAKQDIKLVYTAHIHKHRPSVAVFQAFRHRKICRPRVAEPVFRYKGVWGREGNEPSVLDIGTRWDFLPLYPRWNVVCFFLN